MRNTHAATDVTASPLSMAKRYLWQTLSDIMLDQLSDDDFLYWWKFIIYVFMIDAFIVWRFIRIGGEFLLGGGPGNTLASGAHRLRYHALEISHSFTAPQHCRYWSETLRIASFNSFSPNANYQSFSLDVEETTDRFYLYILHITCTCNWRRMEVWAALPGWIYWFLYLISIFI